MTLSRIAHLLSLGREDEARKLLGALNKFNRSFGFAEHPMPAPWKPLPDGLYIADARKASPAQFVQALGDPDQFVEVTTKPLSDGWHRAEAA